MGLWTVVSSGYGVSIALLETVGKVALVTGFMVVVFLAIVVRFFRFHGLYGDGDSGTPTRRINCSSCGARISAEAETCEYCGESVAH